MNNAESLELFIQNDLQLRQLKNQLAEYLKTKTKSGYILNIETGKFVDSDVNDKWINLLKSQIQTRTTELIAEFNSQIYNKLRQSQNNPIYENKTTEIKTTHYLNSIK